MKSSFSEFPDVRQIAAGRRRLLAAVSLCLAVLAVVAATAYSERRSARSEASVRDSRRSFDVAVLARAVAASVSGKDPSSTAPMIVHPTFSQIIVRSAEGIVCSDPRRRPVCPGQAIDDSGTDTKCAVELSAAVVPPIDPLGSGHQPSGGGTALGSRNSGYYLHLSPGGRLEVGACWPETGIIRLKDVIDRK